MNQRVAFVTGEKDEASVSNRCGVNGGRRKIPVRQDLLTAKDHNRRSRSPPSSLYCRAAFSNLEE